MQPFGAQTKSTETKPHQVTLQLREAYCRFPYRKHMESSLSKKKKSLQSLKQNALIKYRTYCFQV